MKNIVFFRPERVGYESVNGMAHIINGVGDDVAVGKRRASGFTGHRASTKRLDHHEPLTIPEDSLLVRWGCRGRTEGIELHRQVNKSAAIRETGDKRGFREKLMRVAPHLVPHSYFSMIELPHLKEVVLRTAQHARGKGLWKCKGIYQLYNTLRQNNLHQGDWYASDYVEKVAEYRVYIMEGRVVKVDNKIPADPKAVAWNTHGGGKFENVKWEDWVPLAGEAIKVALEVDNNTSLDFGGYDVMVDGAGRAYLLEVNTAPSVTPRDDGLPSYSQKCMAKGFMWMAEHGLGKVPPVVKCEGWRDVIHPAIWSPNKK